MTIEIRPIASTDAETVASLMREFDTYLKDIAPYQSPFSATVYLKDGFGEPRFFNGILLLVNGQAVGYSLYYFGYNVQHAARKMHMLDLFISKSHQGKGLGRALMQELMTMCRNLNIDELIWSIWKLNEPAFAFYAHLGINSQPYQLTEDETFFSVKF